MSIRVTVKKDNLPKVEKAVLKGGKDAVDDILKIGVEFIRSGMEAHSPPAPPGSMPAIRTGDLYGSIHTRKRGPFVGDIYTGQFYAKFLEYGTRTPMPARPFMRPTGRMLRNEMKVKARTYKGKIERAAG